MQEQLEFYRKKLAFEMDPSDLFEALNRNEKVVPLDARKSHACTKGALNMTELGFRVKELIGGIEWWKFDGYATEGTHARSDGTGIQCAC